MSDFTDDSTPEAFSVLERKTYELLIARILHGDGQDIGLMRMQYRGRDAACVCMFKRDSKGNKLAFAPLYMAVTDDIAAELSVDNSGPVHAPQEHMVPGAESIPIDPRNLPTEDGIDLSSVVGEAKA